MKKLRVGVPMRGGIVKLTAKSAAKDKGMASQDSDLHLSLEFHQLSYR